MTVHWKIPYTTPYALSYLLHIAISLLNFPNAYTVTIISVDPLPPTNVRATVISSRSVQITWEPSSSSDVIGYLISYTTTASYTSGGNVTVGNTAIGTIPNLEEGTLYTIAVQATTNDNRMSAHSNEVSVRTYTDSK